METIHIVTAINEAYGRYLAVMLHSLFDNKTSKNKVKVHVLHDDLSDKTRYKLRVLVKKYNAQIRFIRVDGEMLNGIKTNNRYGKVAYYRIFIPELLKSYIEKAIYLDCDVIVKKDITELWNKNLHHYLLAAVQDSSETRWKELRIPRNSYFNSGVMLIDVRKWRKYGISKKVIDYIKRNPDKIRYADQCGLNGILHSSWRRLHKSWNHPSNARGRSDAAIIHYMSSNKPWSGNPRGKSIYMHYHDKTPW